MPVTEQFLFIKFDTNVSKPITYVDAETRKRVLVFHKSDYFDVTTSVDKTTLSHNTRTAVSGKR